MNSEVEGRKLAFTDASATEELSAYPPRRNQSTVAVTLETWRLRLTSAGVACKSVALHATDPRWIVDFPEPAASIYGSVWTQLRTQMSVEQPVMMLLGAGGGADAVLALRLMLPDGQAGVVGTILAPPCPERIAQVVTLATGWLQIALGGKEYRAQADALSLLELLAHVESQPNSWIAAQEWVNRTAAWIRTLPTPEHSDTLPLRAIAVALFYVASDRAQWWVGSDVAWAEKGSPVVDSTTEIATRAAVEGREVSSTEAWAYPLLDSGIPSAVLVIHGQDCVRLSKTQRDALRTHANLIEPLLRHWRLRERNLLQHLHGSLQETTAKLTQPGHRTWKAGAIALAATIIAITLIPVTDRIDAPVVIEGDTRQVVTAPFDGFIGSVEVRPGERVKTDQTLATLDEREIKLEQQKLTSEREQASSKLRHAMAERDAPQLALAQAELQQAEAQLALVNSKLARTKILAPLDGLIIRGDWAQQLGSPVETGKELFEVAATDNYRVVLHVDERDITRVKIGQAGIIRLTGRPHDSHSFVVTRVTATASIKEAKNGFRVEAAWQGDIPPLSPGMQGIGKIEAGNASLLKIWTRSSVDWLRLKWWSWWW